MDQAKLIGPFVQIVTMENTPLKGPISDEDLMIHANDPWILIVGNLIAGVGKYSDLIASQSNQSDIEIIHLTEKYVCIPGLIDCHTHICFGGSRSNDYALRNSGKSYLEIAKSGGGIWDTVQQTRGQSIDALKRGTVNRAKRHLLEGVTTIEIKSGYGLSMEEELKMLRAISLANNSIECDLISTCLAAHILPKDFQGSISAYLDLIADDLLPTILTEGLSNRVDVFVEQGAFSTNEATTYLKKAKALGFDATVHADQFHAGGSEVAIEVGAVSADHLEASTQNEIKLLAKSEVIPVALPGASLGLGMSFTPARKLLDSGASLAIASDWNPGSAPMGDLLLQACLLGASEKLSNAEVLAGLTLRASKALKLTDRGEIITGKLADLAIFPCDHLNEIFYHQGKLKPSMVLKGGNLISKPN